MQKRNLKNYELNKEYPTLPSKLFKDKINIELSKKLCANLETVIEMLPKKYSEIEVNRIRDMVKKILSTCEMGQYTEYKYSKNSRGSFEHGRIFSSTDSLQGVQKLIKNVMVDQKNCVDIDMVNAHPTILNQIASLLKVNTPTLNKYISERDTLLLELKTKYKLSHDEAKKVPLVIINGGIRSKMYPEINWLVDLEQEIILIYNAFIQTEIGKTIDKHVTTSNKTVIINGKKVLIKSNGVPLNRIGATINQELCKIEYEILSQVVFFFQSKNISIYTLCFDGLIVDNNIKFDLEELEKYVYANLGIRMKFAAKSFDDPISNKIISFLKNIIPSPDSQRENINFTNLGITAIKACMSFGKTTQIQNYIKSKPDSSILIITPRIPLAKEFKDNFKSLGFQHYKENKAFHSLKNQQIPRLICQIDSIYKIEVKFDIILLDEVESITNHIVGFDKLKNKQNIIFTLQTLAKYSVQTFLMDANLSIKCKDIFKTEYSDKKFTDLTYTFKPFNGRSAHFIIGSKDIKIKHCNSVIKHLKDKKKVSCPVYSLKYLKSLYTSVRKAIPNCKILRVSSKHKFDSVKDFVDYDLVIYTSSLMCGNNFDLAHFDVIIPLISNTHSSAKLYSQQMLRIRQFEKMIIFTHICKFKSQTQVSESDILDRWKHERAERDKMGIKYDFVSGEFLEQFHLKLFLKETIEIENASSLLVQDLHTILSEHGFKISGESCMEHNLETVSDPVLLKKYDQNEDILEIVLADTITEQMLDEHLYTSAEYSKHIIEKTFDVTLSDDVNTIDQRIEFVKSVHDKIPNHNNFMILKDYKIDDTIYLHNEIEIIKLSKDTIFIPKSKAELKAQFLKTKALEFIKKYIPATRNICEYNDSKLEIDNAEFIEWYNVREDLYLQIVPKIKSKDKVPKTINTLLNIHGLKLTSKQIRVKGGQKQCRENGVRKTLQDDRVREYYITTFIDYKSFDIIGNLEKKVELENLTCYNSYYFYELIACRDDNKI